MSANALPHRSSRAEMKYPEIVRLLILSDGWYKVCVGLRHWRKNVL